MGKLMVIALCIFTGCVLFNAADAYAGLSVGVGGGTWALDTKGAQSETASPANQWTITGASDGTEDILVKVTEGTSTWTARTTNDNNNTTANEFVLRENNSAGTLIKGTNVTLKSGLAVGGTYQFGLWFKTPPTGSSEGAKTLTVTITAANWVFGCPATVTDIDGNSYPVVKIGSQCWMAGNLWVTKNADGSSVNGTGDADTTPPAANPGAPAVEGLMYNWQDAMNGSVTAGVQGICPAAWHLPTDAEWKTLEMALGMTQAQADATGWRGTDQGTQLKSGGSSGFNAILAGYRGSSGSFLGRGTYAYFWSSSESDTAAVTRNLSSTYATVYRSTSNTKAYGFSVRCLKD